jgi:uncharacterized membrane protein YraQ (UPF0718 family)
MIQSFCDWLVYSALGVARGSALGGALSFFFYDSIKIILLLYLMIAVIGILRTYVSPRKIKGWLSGRHRIFGYVVAALFGAVTPFCSCSSIPIFMSMIRAGVPLGPAFSFLVTSPLINEYLVVLMLGFFGLKVSVAYVLFGLLLGVFSGLFMNRLNVGRFIVEDFRMPENGMEVEYRRFSERVSYGLSEAAAIAKSLWLWVLLGVGVGALIHGFVPEKFIQSVLEKTGAFSVPLAVIIGVPLYANCAAIVPIAVVLFEKGVPLGTALAFMMATAALSLPEAVILRRVMRIQLIALFFGTVAVGITLVGYLFNFL